MLTKLTHIQHKFIAKDKISLLVSTAIGSPPVTIQPHTNIFWHNEDTNKLKTI